MNREQYVPDINDGNINCILDKIRTEVKALPNANPSYSGYIDVVDREDVLEIIDKYKESEE